jgi:serine/threonine-protein kinase
MAEIFLARARGIAGMERYVVLKRILRDHAADPRWVEMFLDEARLAARLHHPNIAQVFDLGQIGDTYFFTMEYVHGHDLRAISQLAGERGEALPLGFTLGMIGGATAGLAYAHELCDSHGAPLGIVHRDVSPSNIMVSYDGGVKLMDFGVAKANMRESKTASGAVKGKISYFSPEQCQNRALDARTDVFSLGILLWELCTGTRLYKRESDFAEMNAIINEPAPPPSSINAALPAELDQLVLTALAKDPADRFASARAMQDAIDAVAEGAAVACTPSVMRRHLIDMFGMQEEPWRKLGRRGARKLAVAGGVPSEITPETSGSLPPLRVFEESSNPPTSGVVAIPDVHSEPVRIPRSRRIWVVLGAALATILVVVIGVLVTKGSGDRDSASPAASTPVPLPAAAAAPAPDAAPAPPVATQPPPEPARIPVDAPAPDVKTVGPRPPTGKHPPPHATKKPPTCTDPLDCQF